MRDRDDEPFDEPTPYPHELTNHPDDEARLHAARTRQANRDHDADIRDELRHERGRA